LVTTENVLSIAGSDPSGGAGIQADLKTFAALNAYGMAAITALTAQNTRGVTAVHVPPADFLAAQLDAIFTDIEVHAVKIGMLATAEIVHVVADRLMTYKPRFVVLDPVLVATSGDSLGAPGVVDAMLQLLFPLATLVTPNTPEAARLSDLPEPQSPEALHDMALELARLGPAILVKGGHLVGDDAQDVLADQGTTQLFSAPRVATNNTHGTGCTLSSAIAVRLAQGASLAQAVQDAKTYLTQALRHADELDVGHGHGPVNHGWRIPTP
jgi:hydroxymethylpyrimidine kinase/phosphomethylpyrimidine kinase